jgi:hypothetical protein
VFGHPWRGSLIVLLAAAACSTPATEPTPPSIGDTGSAASSSAASSVSTSPPATPRYPNVKRYSDPFDRFAYKSAYADCRLFGVDGTADGFGGDPQDPPSVARAYAMATFPDAVERQAATLRGCLDGFRAASP